MAGGVTTLGSTGEGEMLHLSSDQSPKFLRVSMGKIWPSYRLRIIRNHKDPQLANQWNGIHQRFLNTAHLIFGSRDKINSKIYLLFAHHHRPPGAATGLCAGTVVGAAVGVVPALFTFGLSIPVGAALGGVENGVDPKASKRGRTRGTRRPWKRMEMFVLKKEIFVENSAFQWKSDKKASNLDL